MKYLKSLFVQQSSYLNHLEGIRALAGVWITYFHCVYVMQIFMPWQNYSKLLEHAPFRFGFCSSLSLDIFFFISGFVITYTIAKSTERYGFFSMKHFLIKRVARVYPTYILLMLLSIPFAINEVKYAWANLIQVNNMLPISKQYLPWTWTLAVDFQFYILYALYFLISDQLSYYYKRNLLIALMLLPIALTLYYSWSAQIWQVSLDDYRIPMPHESWTLHVLFKNLLTRGGPMMIGIFTAHIYLYHQQRFCAWSQSLSSLQYQLISLALICILVLTVRSDAPWFLLAGQQNFFTSTVWLIMMRCVFAAALAGVVLLCLQPRGVIRVIHAILSSAILRPFGQLTFSMYMFSLLIVMLLYGWFFVNQAEPPSITQVYWLIARGFGYSIACAVLMYCYIEMPVMQKCRRWITKASKSVTPAQAQTELHAP